MYRAIDRYEGVVSIGEKRTAVVTGAGKGIGEAVAERLLSRGYTVVGLDIDEEALGRTSSRLQELGSFVAEVLDITSESDVASCLEGLKNSVSPITVLVNNVGGSMGVSQSIEDIGVSDWDAVMTYNLRSTFLVTRAAVPYMKAAGWGRIVNLSSIAGRGRSYFGGTPYAAAKAGILGFTRQASRELGPHGITINAVAPGVVMSGDRIETYWYRRKTEEEREGFLNQVPVGRLGTNEEIAAVVAFLCSEEASYITGAVVDVNGGFWVG